MTSSAAIPTDPNRRASETLGIWEPKRALTLEAARAHTARILLLRRALIALSAVLIGVLIWQFMSDRGGVVFDNDPTESVKMVKPRYSGRTADGLPFYLTSETAIRRMEDRNTILLDQPVLEFVRDEGLESSFVISETGSYNDIEKILELRGDVNLETDDGNVCDTTHARIFNVEKRLEGDEPIRCVGNFGTANGQRYAIEDSYRTFIFDGGMTALLDREGSEPSREPGEQAGDFGFGGDGPIDVKAQKGIYRGARIDLREDVRVVQDGATITSDAMDIYRVREAGASGAASLKLGAIRRIEAEGNFHYVSEDNDIRGTRGVYERDKNIMTVTGNVVVIQPNGYRAESEQLIYNTRTGAIRFLGECRSGNCESGGRVNFQIPGSAN